MTDTMQKQNFPSTMHGMLAVAIADARSLDRTLYDPQHPHWHSHSRTAPCKVCLAGAVIARSLAAPIDRTFTPQCFKGDSTRKLEALDSMRVGKWIRAYRCFHLKLPPLNIARKLHNLPTPDHYDFKGWPTFLAHLDSLESICPALQKIEQELQAS